MSVGLVAKNDADNLVKAQVLLISGLMRRSNVDLNYVAGYIDALSVVCVGLGLDVELPVIELGDWSSRTQVLDGGFDELPMPEMDVLLERLGGPVEVLGDGKAS